MKKLFIALIIAAIIVTIGFVISGIANATAQESISQSNSTNLNKHNIVVIWLETNDTKTSDTPVISVSGEDFRKTFGSLLEQSINGSTSSTE
jgi:uncharacterized alpha/beta hydrolase family protein